MLKKLVKLMAGACLVSTGACVLAVPASAANFMKKMHVSSAADITGGPVIEVESDGEKWTTIRKGSHQIKLNVDIQSGSGWRIWSAYIGVPTADFGGTSQSTDAIRRLGGGSDVKTIKRTETHTFHTDDILLDRISIMNFCNSQGKPPTAEHTGFLNIGVGIKAYFQTRKQANGLHEGGDDDQGRSETAYTRAPVTIKCLAGPTKIEAAPQPFSVDLRVTPQGETCPKKTEVRAFIKYKVPATAQFRFKVDGKLSELHTIKARKIAGKPKPHLPGGGAYYLVERVKTYYLDPGQHIFRIEVRGGKKSVVKTRTITCPPFKVFSSWLNYKVQDTPVCPKNVKEVATFKATRPGSAPFEIKTAGGLVVHRGTATFKRSGREYVAKIKRKLQMNAFDSDMMAVITSQPSANSGWTRLKVECLELAGDFSFIDNGGTKCPRDSKVLMNFTTNLQTRVHYNLSCSGSTNAGSSSHTVNGHVDAIPNGKGGFIAPALVKVSSIKKTTQLNCALKLRGPGKPRILTFKGHLYKCIKRDVEPGSNDLTTGTNPTHQTPTGPTVITEPPRLPDNPVPGVMVDPVRTVSCVNGFVRNRSCFCPRTHTKLKVGPNAYHCEKTVAGDPIRTNGNSGTPGASTETGPAGGAPGANTGTDTSSTGGKPTLTNPSVTTSVSKNPDAEKRRLQELKKRQQAQKKAAAAAKKKAAAAAKKKAAAAKKKAAAAAKKKAAAAKKKAAAAAKKRAAAAKKKAAAAAKNRAAAAKKKAAAVKKKKAKKKGKKKGKKNVAG